MSQHNKTAHTNTVICITWQLQGLKKEMRPNLLMYMVLIKPILAVKHHISSL